MNDTPFNNAITAAIASLNHDGLTHSQWAAAANQCARAFALYEIDDPAVRSAAALGGLILPHATSAPSTISPVVAAFAAATPTTIEVGNREAMQQDGRTALRFATHAALLNSRGLSLVLLAAVERDLTTAAPDPATAPLGTALENWRTATALVGRGLPNISSHLAVAIASNQLELLRRTRELLPTVDINPHTPGSLDRLQDSINTNIDTWSHAAERWYNTSLDTLPHDAANPTTRRLSLASTDLSTALLHDTPASTQLEALIRTGVGGNLIASIVATGPSHIKSSHLVPAARQLDLVADHFTDHRQGPPFNDRAVPPPPLSSPTMTDTAPVVLNAPGIAPSAPEPPPATTPRTSSRQGLDAPVQWVTKEDENDLAQRRDAGILAQAALDRDPTARNLTASVTEDELQYLASDGRAAVAQLIASMIPTLESTNRWIPRHERPDALQNAAIDVAAAAARWDPNKGARWLTYAWNTSYWASTDSMKALDTRPVPVEFVTETFGKPQHNVAPGPEEALLQHLEHSEKRHQIHQIRILDTETIRPDLLEVVVKYHGLDGEPPKNFNQIAEDNANSPNTVARRYREAIGALRDLYATPLAAQDCKPWQRPEHKPRSPDTGPRR